MGWNRRDLRGLFELKGKISIKERKKVDWVIKRMIELDGIGNEVFEVRKGRK